MSQISVKQIISGVLIREGAGVKLTRYIGETRGNDYDPVLLFDYFDSEEPLDYIAGFPSHPHRGFETITYLFNGRMHHQDNHGHEGVIETGDVQWMTAGRGIVHSEMPAQHEGRLAGIQIWLNLPAENKMCEPSYQEFQAQQLPVEQNEQGIIFKVIAGKTPKGFDSPLRGIATKPMFIDLHLPAQTHYNLSIPFTHQVIVFVRKGALKIGSQVVMEKNLAVLNQGDSLTMQALDNDTDCLLLAAKQLKEPVARLGPFVMTTQEEVQQALDDFRSNRF